MGLSCRRGFGASSCKVARVSPSGRHPSPLRPEGWGKPCSRFLQHVFRQPGAERIHRPRGEQTVAQTLAEGLDSGQRGGRRLGAMTEGDLWLPGSTPENSERSPKHHPYQVCGAATAQPQSAPPRRLTGPLPATLGKIVGPGLRKARPFRLPPPQSGVHAGFFGCRVGGEVSALRCFLDSRAGRALPGF